MEALIFLSLFLSHFLKLISRSNQFCDEGIHFVIFSGIYLLVRGFTFYDYYTVFETILHHISFHNKHMAKQCQINKLIGVLCE